MKKIRVVDGAFLLLGILLLAHSEHILHTNGLGSPDYWLSGLVGIGAVATFIVGVEDAINSH